MLAAPAMIPPSTTAARWYLALPRDEAGLPCAYRVEAGRVVGADPRLPVSPGTRAADAEAGLTAAGWEVVEVAAEPFLDSPP